MSVEIDQIVVMAPDGSTVADGLEGALKSLFHRHRMKVRIHSVNEGSVSLDVIKLNSTECRFLQRLLRSSGYDVAVPL